MSLKELREKLAALAATIRALADKSNDEAHEWTAENEENWEKVNADYNALQANIQRMERAEQLEADLRAPDAGEADEPADIGREDRTDTPAGVNRAGAEPRNVPTAEERAIAFQGWARAGTRLGITDEHRQAAELCGITLGSNEMDVALMSDYRQALAAFRANMTTSDGAGGETIPEGFVNNLEVALLAFGGVRQVATVIRTATGNALPWPTTNDTSNVSVLLAEAGDIADQGVSTSSITFNAFKYTTKFIKVTSELMQDSAFNLVNHLGAVMGERTGRGTNAAFTTGTGSSQPKGIVTAATAGKTAASETAITADEMIDLLHSVDPAYRIGARWMFHDNVVLALRKLKDGDNQYLWQPGLQANVADRLLGYPVTINQQMASTMEADAKMVLFGQFKKYIIRDAGAMRIIRLVERFADNDLVAFVGLSRHDGDLLDAGTHPIKYLKMAEAA